jgi:hypothetical protein
MALTDTLAGYRARVRRHLREPEAAKSFWTDVFVDDMINVAYRRRCTQLVMAFEGYFTNVATNDLVAEQERYPWPLGFERCTKMEIVRSDGRTVPIERHERHFSAKGLPSATQDSYTPNYRAISGGFVLEPAPNYSETDGIRLEYTGLPAELVANGDSWHVDFPRSLDELVMLDATIACLDSEGLLETGATRTILRAKVDYENDWDTYIETRMISINRVTPFVPSYDDA